jgi:peptide/nickel transport system substrate-binding protein
MKPMRKRGIMGREVRFLLAAALLGVVALAVLAAQPARVSAQKYGGELKAMLREGWPSMSIHEESTSSATWPMMPLYNNLVLYDPARPIESSEHLVGELAESWSWSPDSKRLTFKLRHGVTWHDGKPFTSADVKYTLDLVRGASDKRLKRNPRKSWYENVQEVTTNGDFEVTVVVKNPQPSLLSLLASTYSPMYPAHIDPDAMRSHAVGTGPFMVKSAKPDEELLLVKNTSYFVKGRPYLDAVRYIAIKSRPTRFNALIAGQLDTAMPGEGTVAIRDQVLGAVPKMVVWPVAFNDSTNVLLNHKKPPFDNLKVRQAVNLALDRPSLIKSVYRGGLLPSGANLPPPYGEWGLPESALSSLPGWGDPVKNKAEARKLLAEAGYGPSNPLKITVSSRSVDSYVDVAVWMISQFQEVGIEAKLETFETTVWYSKLARRDFVIATNLTGPGAEDPDANYFENYLCGSARNYTDYCNKEVEEMIFKQSQETNKKKRIELVRAIDLRLQEDGARPILGEIIDYFMAWPYVKGLVPHNNIHNYSRMQDVWLDR